MPLMAQAFSQDPQPNERPLGKRQKPDGSLVFFKDCFLIYRDKNQTDRGFHFTGST